MAWNCASHPKKSSSSRLLFPAPSLVPTSAFLPLFIPLENPIPSSQPSSSSFQPGIAAAGRAGTEGGTEGRRKVSLLFTFSALPAAPERNIGSRENWKLSGSLSGGGCHPPEELTAPPAANSRLRSPPGALPALGFVLLVPGGSCRGGIIGMQTPVLEEIPVLTRELRSSPCPHPRFQGMPLNSSPRDGYTGEGDVGENGKSPFASRQSESGDPAGAAGTRAG